MKIKQIFFSVLVVVLVVAVGLIPWLDGYFFREQYIAMINARNIEKGTDIKIMNYQLGWLGSTVTLQITPKNNKLGNAADALMQFTVEQRIKHGPLIHDENDGSWQLGTAVIHSDLNFPAAIKMLMKNQDQRSDFTSDTLVTFSNYYSTQFSTASFMIDSPSDFGTVYWAGMSGTSGFQFVDNRIDNVTADINIGAFTTKGGTKSVNIQGISIHQQVQHIAFDLLGGKQTITFPLMVFGDAHGSGLTIKNSQIQTELGLNAKQLFDVSFSTSFDSIASADFVINKSIFSLQEIDVNPKGLSAVLHEMKKHLDSQDMSQVQFKALLNLTPALITPTTVIKADLNIDTSYGRFSESGQLNWPEDVSKIKTVEDIASLVRAKARVTVSISLVNAVIRKMFNESDAVVSSAALSAEPTEQGLLEKINGLGRDKKVQLDVVIQLKDLVKTHLDIAAFNSNIDGFVVRNEISAEVADQLKTAYAIAFPEGPNATPPVNVAAKTVSKPASKSEMIEKTIKDWLQQGLIKQVNETYVTDFTYENGVVKANGIVLPDFNQNNSEQPHQEAAPSMQNSSPPANAIQPPDRPLI